MGSVKDLVVLKEPSEKPGLGRFIFSNRYSVFDYGEMPDKIEDKGRALCMVTAHFFEKLEEAGIATHYLGLVEGGKVRRFDEVENAVNEMEVKLVRVIKPKNGDYSIFKTLKGNFLVPLEIIYRNSIPEGSSLLRRIERGEAKPEDFGLTKIEAGMRLERPIVDFSTKLEDVDRYLSHPEAKEISGLSDGEFEALKELVVKVDEIITREVSKVGLINEDGKIEVALDDERNLIVVDAVGTPDECRFSFDGFEVSKELLRKYYRKTEWYGKVRELKGQEGWREAVGSPPPLPAEIREGVSNLYRAFCNEVTGRKFFDAPKLKEVVSQLKEVLE
ncbi:phosphoribosylaminoimidazolesuccinocarboxamide synthase [Archaeoglobus sp.]|uniref:phosphoribosylaminoimidazolesuccinocarboxamide synthase n=1 Tax=Archaeoglobus sp. TaxID=1872626 RepID=UPI0024AB2F41|nr:phosphoribosylaminoimidazolesuccinocarboxamide synthase [Archaeoglobus sp.]MDI3498696.1 phosphoribosylaminoimidazole-succinocarboxamide synthase [Archaeoglobus sp.]